MNIQHYIKWDKARSDDVSSLVESWTVTLNGPLLRRTAWLRFHPFLAAWPLWGHGGIRSSRVLQTFPLPSDTFQLPLGDSEFVPQPDDISSLSGRKLSTGKRPWGILIRCPNHLIGSFGSAPYHNRGYLRSLFIKSRSRTDSLYLLFTGTQHSSMIGKLKAFPPGLMYSVHMYPRNRWKRL